MGEFIEYPDVLQEVRGAMNPGRLKLQSKSIVFKNIKTGIVEQFQSSDIDKATWLIRARGHCLKVLLESGTTHRFDGFKDSDYEKLSSFVKKHYDKSLKKKDMAVKGWNWGMANFVGNCLEFDIDRQPAFDIPLSNVSHTVTAKNEVTLEFHQNDDAAVSLMELRFHIPTDSNPEKDSVNEFYENVVAKADIIQATGDAIANFTEVQCLTPRGRYDIKIYQSFMQLHGKTFDYKIPHTTILRLFLLPHRDNRQMFFVVSLDPPIKQGQTRYHFLIVLFNKEYETTLELGLSEKDLKERYDGKLSQSMSGPEYEIISRVMKTLVNRKITVPGTFIGNSGSHAISCSYKAATGFLYPLERGFIFVHKPPMHIRFDEVSNVNFARSTSNTRSFDFEVDTKTGTVYTFVSIEKDEYDKLYDFVKHKKLRVKNIGNKLDKKGATYDDMVGSDDEGVFDPYMAKMKAEGQERDEGEEDEDSSEDEDFNPGLEVSEPDDEFDSNAGSTNSEDGSGAEETPKKEKKKKVKTVSEGGTRRKHNKKERDPDQPKRPQSSYFLWLNEMRETIKRPGMSVTDVSKKAGEMWREVKDRTKWEDKAAKEKEAYKEAMEVWKANQEATPSSPQASKPKQKRKKAGHKSPVKPTSAGAAGSTVGGAGLNFKSKEFISDESSSGEDSDKPLKSKRAKGDKKAAKSKKEEKSESDEAMESDADDKPLKKSPKKPAQLKKSKRGKKKESDEEEAESDDDKPLKKSPKAKKSPKKRGGEEDSEEFDGLPTDESEAEMTDESDGGSGSGSGEESESGSGSEGDESD